MKKLKLLLTILTVFLLVICMTFSVNAAGGVKSGNFGDVPPHLKDASTFENKQLEDSKRYKYPHSYPNHWIKQQYLPDMIKDAKYYQFGENKTEQAAKAYWEKIKK